MRHIAAKDLKGPQRKRREEAIKKAYRKVLLDPGASKHQKDEARAKLASTRALGSTNR